MKFEIELKSATARRIGIVTATITVFGVAAVVYANQIQFSSGQTLTAAGLNSNFNELYASAAKPTVTKNGKSISIGGTYCGVTATTYDGSAVGGYTGAKAKCETACASATAHMCDAVEIGRSEQLGIAPANGAWVAAFTDTTDTTTDCISWTNNTNNNGMVWNQSLPMILHAGCGTAHAIACCD